MSPGKLDVIEERVNALAAWRKVTTTVVWGIVLALAVCTVSAIYGAGRLSAQLDAALQDLGRVEQQVDRAAQTLQRLDTRLSEHVARAEARLSELELDQAPSKTPAIAVR